MSSGPTLLCSKCFVVPRNEVESHEISVFNITVTMKVISEKIVICVIRSLFNGKRQSSMFLIQNCMVSYIFVLKFSTQFLMIIN